MVLRLSFTSFCALDLESDVDKFALSWLYHASQYISGKDGVSYMEQFQALSNRQLNQLLAMVDDYDSGSDSDLIDYFNNVYQMQMKDDYDMKKSFCSDLPVLGLLTGKKSELSYFQHIFSDAGATDRVHVSLSAFQKLFDSWQKYGDGSFVHHVPIDLLLLQKILIRDMEICLTDIDSKYEGKQAIIRVKYLVEDCAITSDFDETEVDSDNDLNDGLKYKWHDLSDPHPFPIGVIDVPLSGDGHSGFIVTFGVMPGVNQIMISHIPCLYGLSEDEWYDLTKTVSYADFIQFVTFFLQVWYTLQVSLNSDVWKKLFDHPVRQKDRRKCLSGIKCVKIARPIQIHIIKESDVQALIQEHLNDSYDMQYLVGGWEYVSVESDDEDDSVNNDIMLVPSGWYRFNKTLSKPIDWSNVRSFFANDLYHCTKDDPDFVTDAKNITNLLSELINKNDENGGCEFDV